MKPHIERALELRLAGWTFEAIGKEFGRSRQRVQQWLSPPAHIRSLIIERSGGCCESCGLKLGASGHIHHPEDDSLLPESYNTTARLQYLCPSCHLFAHRHPWRSLNIGPEPTAEPSSKRRINLVLPDPSWRVALKRLAKRARVPMSEYICYQLQLIVNRELEEMRRNGDNA